MEGGKGREEAGRGRRGWLGAPHTCTARLQPPPIPVPHRSARPPAHASAVSQGGMAGTAGTPPPAVGAGVGRHKAKRKRKAQGAASLWDAAR